MTIWLRELGQNILATGECREVPTSWRAGSRERNTREEVGQDRAPSHSELISQGSYPYLHCLPITPPYQEYNKRLTIWLEFNYFPKLEASSPLLKPRGTFHTQNATKCPGEELSFRLLETREWHVWKSQDSIISSIRGPHPPERNLHMVEALYSVERKLVLSSWREGNVTWRRQNFLALWDNWTEWGKIFKNSVKTPTRKRNWTVGLIGPW